MHRVTGVYGVPSIVVHVHKVIYCIEEQLLFIRNLPHILYVFLYIRFFICVSISDVD